MVRLFRMLSWAIHVEFHIRSFMNNKAKDHVVDLGSNISNSMHNCGCKVNGGNAIVTI